MDRTHVAAIVWSLRVILLHPPALTLVISRSGGQGFMDAYVQWQEG